MRYVMRPKGSSQSIRNHRGVTVCLAFALSVLAVPANAQESQEPSFLTEQTEEFFSDQSRVGSIVGGILAGAAFANPFAPLGGTIIGFIVGKSTDFSEQEEAQSDYYARRSFAPATADGQTETLALSIGGPDVDGSGVGAAAGAAGGAMAGLALSGGSEDENGEEGASSTSGAEDAEPPQITAAGDADSEGTADDTAEVADSKPATEEKAEPRPKPTPNLIISKDVGGRQAELDKLAATIRAEQDRSDFEVNQQCMNQQASRIRKKIVVAGFNLQHPDQAVFGGLGSVGTAVHDALYQNLLQTGEVLPFAAPGRQMFASLNAGPSREAWGNRIDKYSAVSRQMGAQFVVSGIIRSVSVNRADSWDSSYGAAIKRSLFSADTVRQFVVDVVLHDGYTGQVVSENRYTAEGRWDVPRTGQVAFGSPEFDKTGYGESVNELMTDIAEDVMASIDCQAMLIPILQVTNKDLLLDVGTRSGLLPGDKLRVVRAEYSLQRPDAPPKLWDTGVDLHIHQLSLDTSRAWMPAEGGAINIREGDYAVIY